MNDSSIPTVILCGGTGTRLREETEYRPKPLVPVGEMPVLWHIMKIYSHYGFRDFVLCLGYKGAMIKQFFLEFELLTNDFTLNLRSKHDRIINYAHTLEDWHITFSDTGIETNTGGRLFRVRKYLAAPDFFMTYGDGLANVDLKALYQFHKKMGKIATLTAVHPMSPFGIIETKNGLAKSFKEKPRLEDIINGGFFVFNRKIFDYLDDACILEEKPLRALARDHQLAVYEHKDFWMCMDTFKDVERLNKMWREGTRPWVTWKENASS